MKNLQKVIPIVLIILILTVVIPTINVQGKLEAEYSISVEKKEVIGTNHWKVYVKEDISFISSSSDATSYTWDFGDGASVTKTTKTIAHNFSAIGTYTVTLTAKDDDGNSDTAWGNITAVEKPEAIIIVLDEAGNSLADVDYTIELGQSVTLDASTSKGDIVTYIFGFNLKNAFQPQVQKPEPTYTHTYEEVGEYKVGLRVTDTLHNNSQMDKSEFITITVKKASASSTSFELPVPIMYVGGGVGIIVLLLVVVFLYRNGYIGAPGMGGGGGSPSSPPMSGPARTSGPNLNTRMSQPSGKGSSFSDYNSLLPDQQKKEFGRPESEKTVYEVKTCPKCKGKIPITSLERPLKVTCPTCAASFSLKKPSSSAPPSAAKAPTPEAPAPTPEAKQDFIYDVKTCPKCKSKIPITSQERPLKVTCPGCSASFTLKGKSQGPTPGASAPKPAPAPVDDTEIVICPACGKAQPVSTSASTSVCISCNSRFEL